MYRILNPAIECLSRKELLALQERRLVAQIRRCYAKIPFYRERWPAAAAEISSLRELQNIVPFTSKKDFLSGSPEDGGRIAEGSRLFQYHLTSGTSGLGQELHPVSTGDHEGLWVPTAYMAYWAGLLPGDRICYTWPVGLQTGGLQGMAFCTGYQAVGMQLGPYSSVDKLKYMRQFRPNAIVVSPSYLTHLTYLVTKMGDEPRSKYPDLKAIFVAGESYAIAWAEHMQEAWGCQLHEWYGLMQGGANSAHSCEAGVLDRGRHGSLHCMDHRQLTEVLHPDSNEAVMPGEEGELVITALFREAFPVVRFRTGDKVRLLERLCDCGRPFTCIEAGTIARYDDMMKIRGQNLWPAAVDGILLVDDRVEEYSGEVFVDESGKERVVVRIEFLSGADVAPEERQSVLAELAKKVKECTNITMELMEVPIGTLPRFEFKSRRWTDRRRGERSVIAYVAEV